MDKVNIILKKDSINDEDMKIIIANIGSVPESDKVRLGLAPATAIEAVKEPVKEEEKLPLTGEAKLAQTVKEEQAKPVKKTRTTSKK